MSVKKRINYTAESYAGEPDQYRDRTLKKHLFVIIFGTDTKSGKLFDVLLIILILLSVLAVMMESVDFVSKKYGTFLYAFEWVITIAFTMEYIARVWVVRDKKRYVLSFFGLIDLLSIIPTYLSLVVVGSQTLAILRVIRLLRIFRVLRLSDFVSEGSFLLDSLKNSRHRISVFFLGVLVVVIIAGSIMFLIEGPEHGFNSIPLSIYWAIVTMTTVGFGDIYPMTIGGQFLAAFLMLLGYSVIAIPTGIIGAEAVANARNSKKEDQSIKACHNCHENHHIKGALYCHSCGKILDNNGDDAKVKAPPGTD